MYYYVYTGTISNIDRYVGLGGIAILVLNLSYRKNAILLHLIQAVRDPRVSTSDIPIPILVSVSALFWWYQYGHKLLIIPNTFYDVISSLAMQYTPWRSWLL